MAATKAFTISITQPHYSNESKKAIPWCWEFGSILIVIQGSWDIINWCPKDAPPHLVTAWDTL